MEDNQMCIPTSLKGLRACLRCYLVKSVDQWKKEGCPNCAVYQSESFNSYTTNKFEGFLGIMQPKESWVAKSRTLTRKVPGIYCLKAYGNLDRDIMEDS